MHNKKKQHKKQAQKIIYSAGSGRKPRGLMWKVNLNNAKISQSYWKFIINIQKITWIHKKDSQLIITKQMYNRSKILWLVLLLFLGPVVPLVCLYSAVVPNWNQKHPGVLEEISGSHDSGFIAYFILIQYNLKVKESTGRHVWEKKNKV